jgi:signal transduction histidine kinase
MGNEDVMGGSGVAYARVPGAGPGPDLALQLIDTFASVADPGELLREVVLQAVVETRSDRGVLSWIEGDEMVVAAGYDPFGEAVPVNSRWPLAAEQVTNLALAAGRVEGGSYRDISLAGLSAALAETYRGLHGLLVAPVRVAGEDIALVCVSRRRSEPYSASDGRVLEAVARSAAMALRAVRLEVQLHDALAELSELAERTDSVERVKTDVLRLASHELRTPLTVLNGYLSLVEAGFYGDIPEPLAAVMAILQRRTAEMNSLVNDMLVAARVEDVPAVVEGQEVDLGEVLGEAVRDVTPRASERHELRLEVPGHAVIARVDHDRFALALRNVIDNAIKYSPAGGEVRCELVDDGTEACIRVCDHGLGIDPADRDRLFTRFGRVLTADNSHIPGIGLGLYFSREVARRHGGDLRLVDGDGTGCIFEMTLPTVDGAGVRPGAAPGPTAP